MRLGDMRRWAEEQGGPDLLRFRLFNWKLDRPSYAEWAEVVEGSVSHVMGEIASRKADLQKIKEDGLTAALAIGLSCFGVQSRGGRVNGNTDLTVEYAGEYVWIGEAKIYYGVSHVWGGYQQLVTRYADGMPDHSRGGMLLYCYKEDASHLLAEWRGALQVQIADSDCTESSYPLAFVSKDSSAATGLPLVITHYAFPLFHEPLEDVVKLNVDALAAGYAAKAKAKNG